MEKSRSRIAPALSETLLTSDQQDEVYWAPGKVGTFIGRPVGASELRPFLFTKFVLFPFHISLRRLTSLLELP